jgi:hypothetical protein
MKRADTAMYRAKEHGGNSVAVEFPQVAEFQEAAR